MREGGDADDAGVAPRADDTVTAAPRAATLDELRAALVERAGSSDGDAPDVLRGLRVALHEPGATGRMPEALAWLESWLES